MCVSWWDCDSCCGLTHSRVTGSVTQFLMNTNETVMITVPGCPHCQHKHCHHCHHPLDLWTSPYSTMIEFIFRMPKKQNTMTGKYFIKTSVRALCCIYSVFLISINRSRKIIEKLQLTLLQQDGADSDITVCHCCCFVPSLSDIFVWFRREKNTSWLWSWCHLVSPSSTRRSDSLR